MVEQSNCEFRDDTDKLLGMLDVAKIPVLVLSAGVGDLIREIMIYFKVLFNNTSVGMCLNYKYQCWNNSYFCFYSFKFLAVWQGWKNNRYVKMLIVESKTLNSHCLCCWTCALTSVVLVSFKLYFKVWAQTMMTWSTCTTKLMWSADMCLITVIKVVKEKMWF